MSKIPKATNPGVVPPTQIDENLSNCVNNSNHNKNQQGTFYILKMAAITTLISFTVVFGLLFLSLFLFAISVN